MSKLISNLNQMWIKIKINEQVYDSFETPMKLLIFENTLGKYETKMIETNPGNNILRIEKSNMDMTDEIINYWLGKFNKI